MRKRTAILTCTIAAVLTSIGGSALADSFPGIGCESSSVAKSFYGGTIGSNDASLDVPIRCGIVRDTPGTSFAANAIKIDVFDRNTTRDITCYFCNEVATGSTLDADCEPQVTSGSSASVMTLSFSTAPANKGASEYSYVTCSIPRSDGGQFSHVARIFHPQ